MLDAIRAEHLKLRRHRATWLMVWIYPIAIGLLGTIAILRAMLGVDRPVTTSQTAAAWIDKGLVVWSIPVSGPGRWLIAGFAAVAFAGEYAWNTWKLIIPAGARGQLLATKWLVVIGYIYAGFLVADALALASTLIHDAVTARSIPDGVTAAAVASTHLAAAASAAVPILYTVAWAGLLAVLTRSTMATAIFSVAIVSLEQAQVLIAALASGYAAGVTRVLVEVLPLYPVANLVSRARSGPELVVSLSDGPFSTSFETSFATAGVWIVALAVATIIQFQSQDMN